MSDELADDQSVYDDADMDVQSGGANTKGATSHGRTQDGNIRMAHDGNSPADREELDDEYDDADQGFPARVSVHIERPGKGALAIEATAQDGDFVIEDLYYFPKADLADPKTAEKDWERRALYTGPPFNNLDEDLQILLEKYLEERGINTRLALFIPDYIDHKEQKEYVRWLDSKLLSLPLHIHLLTASQTSSSSSSRCCCISVYYLVMYFKAMMEWSRKTTVYDRWRKSLPACATDTNQVKKKL
jgi:complement component 1 Q subcomponent-binding protein